MQKEINEVRKRKRRTKKRTEDEEGKNEEKFRSRKGRGSGKRRNFNKCNETVIQLVITNDSASSGQLDIQQNKTRTMKL